MSAAYVWVVLCLVVIAAVIGIVWSIIRNRRRVWSSSSYALDRDSDNDATMYTVFPYHTAQVPYDNGVSVGFLQGAGTREPVGSDPNGAFGDFGHGTGTVDFGNGSDAGADSGSSGSNSGDSGGGDDSGGGSSDS